MKTLMMRTALQYTDTDFVLRRSKNYKKYSSLYKCGFCSIINYDYTFVSTWDNFNKDWNDRLSTINQTDYLEDPNVKLNQDEILALYHYTNDAYDISEYLKNGNTGVYSCYLDYYYSAWNKLGKSSTDILYNGISNANYFNQMNIFNNEGNYIGEGKNLTTYSITSFTDNLYIALLNADKSHSKKVIFRYKDAIIPKDIAIFSKDEVETEYMVPPLYKIRLGKLTKSYCLLRNDNVQCEDYLFDKKAKLYYFIDAIEESLDYPSWINGTELTEQENDIRQQQLQLYNEENKNFLKSIFGTEDEKVVLNFQLLILITAICCLVVFFMLIILCTCCKILKNISQVRRILSFIASCCCDY